MAKKENNLLLGISESEKVDDFMKMLNHPLKELVMYLRKVILGADEKIGEGIYWNAPTFYYTGEMEPFDPKEYKRYIVGFVFNKQDCIRLVFLQGAGLDNKDGLLEGNFSDNRKLVVFKDLKDIKKKELAFKNLVRQAVKKMA